MSYNLMKDRLFLITDAVTACNIGPYQHQLSGARYVTPEGTISGSNITLLDAMRNCVQYCDIPLSSALKMASAYPARVVKKEDQLGELRPGKAANLLLLSAELTLRKVFIEGVEHFSSIN